jgi:cell division protein ZapA
MPEEKLIPANIIVADRTYRLKIKPEEEETVRKALKIVNDKILEFKTQFAGKDMQDYIAMCLIMYATQPAENNTASAFSSADIEARLQKLESLLDESL